MLLAIKGFSAAMLGGMGNIVGAMFGALVFSFLESFAATFISSSVKDLVTFIVIINVLLFLPHGLAGPRKAEGLNGDIPGMSESIEERVGRYVSSARFEDLTPAPLTRRSEAPWIRSAPSLRGRTQPGRPRSSIWRRHGAAGPRRTS